MNRPACENDDGITAGQEPEHDCATCLAEAPISAELSETICDCLYAFWVAQGIPPERAAAMSVAALKTIWENRHIQGTWVLLPPA